jgi:3-hydroxyacyl-CoA dehydrogenase
MSDKPAVSSVQKGDVLLVLVDNPPVNAISSAVRSGLKEHVEKGVKDPATKAIVIACEGRMAPRCRNC